jgi:hypothetical protein
MTTTNSTIPHQQLEAVLLPEDFLLESGKIFQPLGFDQGKALTFLRETSLSEEPGRPRPLPLFN